MSVCYAVASGKGGVGKSVLTANIAACLSIAGERVLVVDADIGLRSQDALLGLENRVVYDLIDVARGDCEPVQAVLPCESYPSLHLLPAAQFERAKALEPKKFSGIIRKLRDSRRYRTGPSQRSGRRSRRIPPGCHAGRYFPAQRGAYRPAD